MTTNDIASKSGTFTIGGDLTVNRLGFGTMRLTGNGIWGPPDDRDEAIRVLRRAVELGIDFFDTANSYGPYVAEELIREALHPYRDGLVIATKAGLLRTGENQWTPLGFPAYLRQEVEMSLRRLGTDRIDLFQLHRIDSKFPAEDQVGELAALQKGYNMAERTADPLLAACEAQEIAFIPWAPLGSGPLVADGGPLQRIASHHRVKPSQLAVAWLLKRSPVMVPIPGTSRVAHLEENVAAAEVTLTDAEFEALTEPEQ